MRVELARLRRTHNIALHPVTVPMMPPTDRSQILSGYAATLDVDLARQRFRPYAFGPVHRRDPPPLYYKHDTTREVGTIDQLGYDAHGALTITATVTCPLARRCNAFSVSCTVRDYEIVNSDKPDFYALIKSASLAEVSVSDIPANPAARVTHRRDVCARVELLTAAQSHIATLSKLVTLIQGELPR